MRKQLVWTAMPLIAVGALFAATGAAAVAPDSESYSTKLTGAAEVPGPGDPDGTGDFAAIATKRTLCYVLAAGRVEPISASHIHAGASDVAGPVAITLKSATRKGVSDCITAVPDAEDTGVTMSESELAAIKSDPTGFYVNVHNAAYPGGAVRGQLVAG